MSDAERPLSGHLGLALLALFASLAPLAVSASPKATPEKVRGFFCKSKAHQIEFLAQQARGENAEMAANTVNKNAAMASCAYYMPLHAIPGSEETIFADGLTFVIQKFVFLPEMSEHWAGTVMGSVQQDRRESNI